MYKIESDGLTIISADQSDNIKVLSKFKHFQSFYITFHNITHKNLMYKVESDCLIFVTVDIHI